MAGRRAVGLDIGTTAVRAAEVTLGKGGAADSTLRRFGQVVLPPGAVRNGEVVEPDIVAAALKQLWAKAKFGTKKVAVGVANQKVIVRQVEVPWLPASELRASLVFQVQDYIPMPVDEAILDFHPLEELVSENGTRVLRGLLVAAARDMVNSQLAAVQKAGLSPQMVDLTPFAVMRSLNDPHPVGLSGVEAEALVDIGASVTNIVVHQGGVPRFVRILLMGGGDVTQAVAERLGVELDQAESVKQSIGSQSLGNLEPGTFAAPHPAEQVIETVSDTFCEEVRGSLTYHLGQPGATRLSRIVLSGGGGQLHGLADRLSAATRLPVQHGSPLALVRLGQTGLTDDQLHFVKPVLSVPVGLAMGLAA